MDFFRRMDERWKDNALWQFAKFNLVALTITLVQLILANLLPLLFDGLKAPLPPLLRPIFDPERLFDGPSPYVTDGVVSWGYVLPFFLSNFLANLYGYFVNMRATFPNPNRLLHNGGSATVVMPTTFKNCVVVPQEATYELQNKVFVYRVVNGVTKATPVEVHPQSNGKEYIIKNGLNVGDTIVAEGAGLLKEGVKI